METSEDKATRYRRRGRVWLSVSALLFVGMIIGFFVVPESTSGSMPTASFIFGWGSFIALIAAAYAYEEIRPRGFWSKPFKELSISTWIVIAVIEIAFFGWSTWAYKASLRPDEQFPGEFVFLQLGTGYLLALFVIALHGKFVAKRKYDR